MSRRSRLLLVGILLAVVAVAGVVAGIVGLAVRVNDGSLTSADGTKFGVTFPGLSHRERIKVGGDEIEAWVSRDGDTEYAAWAVKFTEAELADDLRGALGGYVNRAANREGPVNAYRFGLHQGLPEVWTDGAMVFRPGEKKVPNGWGTVRAVLCDDTAFVMRVFGSGAKPTAPHVMTFFNSLRIPNAPTPPLPLPPDDEDLTTVKRIDPTPAVAFALDSTALFVVSTPREEAEKFEQRRRLYHPELRPLTPPAGVLKRYTSPAFAPDGTWPVATAGYRLLVDERRQRLILAAHVTGHPDDTAASTRPFGELHVYDLTTLPAHAGKAEPTKVIDVRQSGGHVAHLSLTPDGKHLLALVTVPPAERPTQYQDEKLSKEAGRPVWVSGGVSTRRQTATLRRFDADTLKPAGELPVHDATESIVRVPGTDTYFAAASLGGHKSVGNRGAPRGQFEQIDMGAFKITRRFQLNVHPSSMVATADGKLLVATGTDSDNSLAVIDPTRPGDPRVRRVDGIYARTNLALSPNGKKLYVSREGIHCWDAEQAIFCQRRWEVGGAGTDWGPDNARRRGGSGGREEDRVSGLVAISPDGRFAATASGHILRLNGAAP